MRQSLFGHPAAPAQQALQGIHGGYEARLSIAEDDIFYYPDVFVTGDPTDNGKYFKTQPLLIIEVLSPSTERLDRREKFLSYRENAWKPAHYTEAP